MSKLQQRGDTIVEVLIAIVIASSVLIGAFISAQRSLKGTRQSEERIEALKVAESQVEKLRKAAITAQGSLFDSAASNEFCVDASGTRNDLTAAFPAVATSDTFTEYPGSCITTQGGVKYNTAVIRDLPSNNKFVIHVRWDRFAGGGKEELTQAYRIYP